MLTKTPGRAKRFSNEAEEGAVLPAPEKGQVDDGSEGIKELQDERFKNETLFKTLVRLWNLWEGKKQVLLNNRNKGLVEDLFSSSCII